MFKVIRDPVWNNIQVDREALGVLDTEPFQRLRYVRQLGHAYLVYPGATHTRFEHALGAYHLARRALDILEHRGELEAIPAEEHAVIRLAALLHDIGHFPFSHALEEAGLASHEDLAARRFEHPELRDALATIDIDDLPTRLAALIDGTSRSPLRGLISGSLDLDKIEYLTRDAQMTGVPYGAVDVDRLLHSLTVVETRGGEREVGIREKGTSALESLLFARYQMYRNVYWHHTVRSATAMFKRLVRTALGGLGGGALQAEWIAQATDEELMERIRALGDNPIALRLRGRHLFKRVIELPGDEFEHGAGDWIAVDPDLTAHVEDQLADELGLAPGELLLDFPAKEGMLRVDIPLLTREGRVDRLGGATAGPRLGLERVGTELYQAARRLRVFSAAPCNLTPQRVRRLVTRSGSELRRDLQANRPLL